MAATKSSGRNGSRVTGVRPGAEGGRRKSVFTQVGDEAKAEAQRSLLLKTLRTHDWNLTATAEALEMSAIANVIRALRELAPEEYEAAKADGRISTGNRRV